MAFSFLKNFKAPVKQGSDGEFVEEDNSEGVDPQKVLIDTRSPEEIKEERRYVWKLDAFLLVFGCVSQVIKYLGKSAWIGRRVGSEGKQRETASRDIQSRPFPP